MSKVTLLAPFNDDKGNSIEYLGDKKIDVNINFTGSNNKLVVHKDAKISKLSIAFDCSNGVVEIGGNTGAPAFIATLRVGQDSTITFGENVSMTAVAGFSAVEGSIISVGNDVMFASDNQVRTDDGHPIFDVNTGQRINVSKSITIADHVWLGWGAKVLSGAQIGEGTVIGMGSIVTGSIPNNCIAVGVPAKVVRTDTAWERPHLSLVEPFYKPDASTITKSKYWNHTVL